MENTATVPRRRRYYQRYMRTIRIQRFIILLLALLLAMALLTPSAGIETPAKASYIPEPTDALALVPANEEPIAETESPEATPVFLGEFKLTAYCACIECCGKNESDPWYGITASGARATAGHTIAVDPSVIPLGTEVVIDGCTYTAEDVGGAIKENRIDIYFDSHQEALEFGVQYADVYLK